MDDILVRLKMKGEEFSRGVKEAFGQVPDEARRAGEQAGDSFAAGLQRKAANIALVASTVLGVTEAIRRSMDFARDLDATSKQIGINVESLQNWRYAAQQAGVEANELDTNVSTLTRKIGEANAGTKAAQQAFVGLGVGFKSVNGDARTTEATFVDVVQRLSEIEDPTKRAQLGTALLGEEYGKLEPLVRGGADGLREAEAELDAVNGQLTQEQIDNLRDMNAEFDRMKQILSVSVAGVVADNADAIAGLANALGGLAAKSLQVAIEYPRAISALGGAAIGGRFGGLPGAVIGAGAGFVGGTLAEKAAADNSLDSATRAKALRDAQAALARAQKAEQDGGSLFSIKRADQAYGTLAAAEQEVARQKKLYQNALDYQKARKALEEQPAALGPTVSGAPVRSKRGAGSSGKSEAEREAERAAKEALRNEERFDEAVRKTLESQRDSAAVERVRAEQGEVAAAGEEARLQFLRDQPLAAQQTVEALAAALGITKQLTDADRQRLQTMIDQADEAERGAIAAAKAKTQGKIDRDRAAEAKKAEEEMARERKRLAEIEQRAREDQLRELSFIYEELFTGGSGRIWKDFRRQGMAVLAEIAAQYTLALLSGQQVDGGLIGAAGRAAGGLPIGRLFGNVGTRAAANDNTVLAGAGGFGGSLGGDLGGNPWAGVPGAGGTAGAGTSTGSRSLLDQAGVALAAASIAQISGIGGGGTFGQIGGLAGSIGGQALGGSLAALGAFGGPVGALAGAVIGTLFGDVLDGLFNPNRTARANITGAGSVSLGGKDSGNYGTANTLAGSVIQGLQNIAEALGADLGTFNTTIGVRGGDFRVNRNGTSLKLDNGAINFNDDQEAAIRAAIADAIADGAIKGISAASQRILQSGQDLEKAIEKASLIEAVPRLLRERLDPLGAALDEIDAKFRDLAAALKEGGASAEQVAQARKLWQLEREDAVRQIGDASKSLKDFLASLNAGSNSPLSLRQQRAEADARLAPFEQQVRAAADAKAQLDSLKASGASASEIAAAEKAARTAAAGIDQQGFQDAAQLVLSISRQMNGSSGSFFADFDRIRTLTGGAIGAIDAATPRAGEGSDPFAGITAQNTGDMVNLLNDTNDLLRAMNDNFAGYAAAGGYSYVAEMRNWA